MRVSVFCVAIMLAWPAQAYGLRPLNAGQEESAVANLAHAFAPTGLEELSAKRRITLALSPWDDLWTRPLHVYPNGAGGWRSTLQDAFGRALEAAGRLDQGSLAAAIADRLALVWGRPLTPEERADLQRMSPRDQVGQLYWATALHGDMAESAKPLLAAMAFQQRVPGDRLHAWVVSLMQAPLMWQDLGVIATRVVSLDDAARARALVLFPQWLTEFMVHLPLLQSWGYGPFMRDYLTETPVPELLESPVIVWRFPDRDMTRWLKDQAAAVEQLRWWAGTRSIQPVWEVDGRERTPLDFAATVAFHEPHRLRAIEDAFVQRDRFVVKYLTPPTSWRRWKKLFAGRPLPSAPRSVQLLVSVERSLMPGGTIHRVVGWWQRLMGYPLDRAIPRETVAALAAYTLTTLQKEGMSSFEQDPNVFSREIARRFLSESAVANLLDEPTATGLEEGVSRRRFLWRVGGTLVGAAVAPMVLRGQSPSSSVVEDPEFARAEAWLQRDGGCVPQAQVEAALRRRFENALSNRAREVAEQIWREVAPQQVPIYLVSDLDRWKEYLKEFGHPVAFSHHQFSPSTSREFVAAYAPTFDVGLFLHEVGVHIAVHRRLWAPLLDAVRRQDGMSSLQSPRIEKILALNRADDTGWRALVAEMHDFLRNLERAHTALLEDRLMAAADLRAIAERFQAAVAKVPADPGAVTAPAYDPFRTTIVGETLGWGYLYLVAPWPQEGWLRHWNGDPPTEAERAFFLNQAAAEPRRIGYRRAVQSLVEDWQRPTPEAAALRQQLRRVYTELLHLPDPWPSTPAISSKGGLEERQIETQAILQAA